MKEKKLTYTVFKVGKEKYALHVDFAERIVVPQYIREVPNTSKEIRGITNIDDFIVTVVDLRIKFDLKSDKIHETPYIIISRHDKLKDVVVGFVVDEVNEVLTITPDKEGNIPINTNITGSIVGNEAPYIYGVYRKEKQIIKKDEKGNEREEKDYDLIIVLDAEKLLTEDMLKELADLKEDTDQ